MDRQRDGKEFTEIWRAVMDDYQRTVTPEGFRLAFAALQDYSLDDIRVAISRHMADSDKGAFCPRPADVIRWIDGTTEDRGSTAWVAVRKAMGSAGAYRSVIFDDPFIHCAIEALGGWPAVCHGKSDALPFLEKDFLRHYRAAVVQHRAHPPVLYGLLERDNGDARDRVPMLLGPEEACRLVFETGREADRIAALEQHRARVAEQAQLVDARSGA